jgi:hypothetical protein
MSLGSNRSVTVSPTVNRGSAKDSAFQNMVPGMGEVWVSHAVAHEDNLIYADYLRDEILQDTLSFDPFPIRCGQHHALRVLDRAVWFHDEILIRSHRVG